MEENVLQPQCLMSPPPNQRAGPRLRDLAFKSIGKKRKGRVARDKLRRTRASPRLDLKSIQTHSVKKQVQISNQTEEKTQREGTRTQEPEHELKQGSRTGKKPPVIALDPKATASSPKKTSKKLEAEEDPKLKKDKSDSKGKCGEGKPVAASVEDDDEGEEEEEEEEEEEDVVNRIIGALTEEDEDDNDIEGLFKSVERKCPYCQDPIP
ncbi:neuromodulin-like [Xyrauchen texanus]|uniref:neuromodulin-like n=1 Tax=Xyrauchen texanus TaxID=154827 RepID=UPI002241BBB0|nr:neuromodulin-like [Xyrauchen texanus]